VVAERISEMLLILQQASNVLSPDELTTAIELRSRIDDILR
jgi:nuclear pore complex protein Nup155